MKKMFILAIVPFLFIGCIKSTSSTTNCTNVTPAAEEAQIIAYFNANGITYIKDPSGIYYQILELGTLPHPTLSSTITTNYVGKLLNGVIVDQSSAPFTSSLNQLIAGWQIGIQLIGKGGHIKMVVPSSLAYGCYGAPPTIAPNSLLYFDITLVNVQ